MYRIVAILTLVVFPIAAPLAAASDMTCKASTSVGGPAAASEVPQRTAVSDVFRVSAGRLFHSWRGRDEYTYGHITEVGPGRYAAGHMMFVMAEGGGRRGYVVIAAPTDWRIVYVECRAQ